MRRVLTVLLLSLAAQAAEQSLSLKIEGWHSKDDVYKTEHAVQQVKGVRSVSSDLTNKEMRVVFDDATASAAAI